MGETLTANSADADGNYATATSSGVLQGVDIVYGGSGYEKGEELNVSGGGGTGAKAKIGSIAAAALTGIVVIDSGDGYTVGDVVEFVMMELAELVVLLELIALLKQQMYLHKLNSLVHSHPLH